MANVKDFINENLDEAVEEINEAKVDSATLKKSSLKKMNDLGAKIAAFKDPGKQARGLPAEIGSWYHQTLAAQKAFKKLVMGLKDDGIVDKAIVKKIKEAEKAINGLAGQINKQQAAITSFGKKSEVKGRVAGYKTEKKAKGKEKTEAFKKNVKKKMAAGTKKVTKTVKKAKDANPAKSFMAQFKKS